MTTQSWTLPDLLQLSGGYWSTCALHAAVKLDVFSIVADQPHTAGGVAQRAGADARAMGMLLDSLTALALLVKDGDAYKATDFACYALNKQSSGYIGHIIMHHHHLMSGWAHLDEAVRSGSAIRHSVAQGDDEVVRESFLMGMFNLASLMAPKIAPHLPLAGCRTLLDLGGGPGTYAIHFCQENPQLTATIYDLPTTRAFAEKTIARFNLEGRISFAAGDYHHDAVTGTYDAAWLSHVLHSEGPQGCAELLNKAVAALNPGGILLVQEFILSNEKDGPVFPALFSLNMLLGTGEGQSYSEGELTAMMTAAGLVDVRRLELNLPNGAGVMCGHCL